MKLLFPFVGDSIGGSHLSALELCKILKENDHDVIILLHDMDGPLSKMLKKSGIEHLKLKTAYLAGKSPNVVMIFFGMLWNIFPLAKFILKNDVDIVHGNDLRINLTWSVAARMARAKFIWHQRTILSGSHLWKCITFLCDHFIGISQAVLNSAPNNISSGKKSLVYNAFDSDIRFDKVNSRNAIKKSLPKCQNCLILGCVGRLVPYKNVDFIIRCMPDVINSCTFPIHLLVVGSGTDEYTIYLKSIVEELDLQANVSFMGFVTNPSEIISGLDLLVAPSSRDAFGRSIVESMLQATPVLVANKGGHLEIVEDELNGSLYMANCQNSFIEKTLRLALDDSFRETLASRALEESRSKYSKNTLLLKVGRIYKSVLNH